MTETDPNELVCVHIWVTGRVQGVGFRAFVLQSGVSLGLTGWVRNGGYDQVEAVAEGRRGEVERFIETVKTGPRASRVEAAHLEWETPAGKAGHFQIRF